MKINKFNGNVVIKLELTQEEYETFLGALETINTTFPENALNDKEFQLLLQIEKSI